MNSTTDAHRAVGTSGFVQPVGPSKCDVCGEWPARMTERGQRCHLCESREWCADHPVPLPDGKQCLEDLASIGVPGAAEKLAERWQNDKTEATAGASPARTGYYGRMLDGIDAARSDGAQPYVTIRRKLPEGKLQWEAYTPEGAQLATAKSISGTGSLPAKFNARIGRYASVVNFDLMADTEQAVTPEWIVAQVKEADVNAAKDIAEADQRVKDEAEAARKAGEGDTNIGREWNSPYGRQKIVGVSPGGGLREKQAAEKAKPYKPTAPIKDYALEWGTEESFNTALDQLRDFVERNIEALRQRANETIPLHARAAAVEARAHTMGPKAPTWAQMHEWLTLRARQAAQSAGIEWTPEGLPEPVREVPAEEEGKEANAARSLWKHISKTQRPLLLMCRALFALTLIKADCLEAGSSSAMIAHCARI